MTDLIEEGLIIVTRATYRGLKRHGFNRRSVWKRLRNIEGRHIIVETVERLDGWHWQLVTVIDHEYDERFVSEKGHPTRQRAMAIGLRCVEDVVSNYVPPVLRGIN
jgi:hypothetical protein